MLTECGLRRALIKAQFENEKKSGDFWNVEENKKRYVRGETTQRLF